MDADCRPERMTAIVGHELARYNIAVAALSETRRADTGCVKEMGAGYTFFWSGKAETEPRVSGVGFAIQNDIASSLTSLPKGISDRIMTLRLSLASKTHLTLISVYAPTMTHPDEEREAFYCCLREAIHSVPSKDKLLLLGISMHGSAETSMPGLECWAHMDMARRTPMVCCCSVSAQRKAW